MKTLHQIAALHFFLSLGTWFLGSYPILTGGTRNAISVLSRDIFTVINYPGGLAVRLVYDGYVFDFTSIIIVYALAWVLLTEWPVYILAYAFRRFVTITKKPRF